MEVTEREIVIRESSKIKNMANSINNVLSKTRRIEINGLRLDVLKELNDANWYQQRHVYEEKVSLLYTLLVQEHFTNFVDIGANYGYISMLMRLAKPDMNILAIEADTRLSSLIESNFRLNGLACPLTINAIAGERFETEAEFSINPNSSLDNRVSMENWGKEKVDKISAGETIKSRLPTGKTFVKIDTQGYEFNVLKGLESYLQQYSNWLVKMEFGPQWLESQGTDSIELLQYLDEHYEFAEMPARVRFNTEKLCGLFDKRICHTQFVDFDAYVRSLNKNGLGWVDLIVRQREGKE